MKSTAPSPITPADRKRRERAKALSEFGVRPRTLYLSAAELCAMKAYSSRRFGHDLSLQGRTKKKASMRPDTSHSLQTSAATQSTLDLNL